jgi:hypothetical protein
MERPVANRLEANHINECDNIGSPEDDSAQAAEDGQLAEHHLAQRTLVRLNVKEGDRLFVIETRHGVMVTPYHPQFIERFKHAYKVLADR